MLSLLAAIYLSLLSSNAAYAGEGFVTLASGAQIFVSQESAKPGAPTLVLLHGLSCDTTTFEGMLPALRAAGAGIVRIDLLGHGRTLEQNHARPGREITISEQADAVAEALRVLKLPAVTLLGHSYGGALVVELAARPELKGQLKGIYLLAPYVYRRDHVVAHEKFPFADWDLLVRGIYPPLPSDLVYDSYVISEFRKFYDGVFRARWRMVGKSLSPAELNRLSLFVDGATAVTVGARSFYSALAVAKLDRSLPIHLTVALKDELVPIAVERAFHRAGEAAGLAISYEELAGGHMLEEDQPAEIAASLLKFVSTLR